MNIPTELGKLLILFGGLLVLIGALVLALGRISIPWRLPGDIVVQRPNFTFYFPLVTCILLSILLTLLFQLLRLFRH